MHPSRTSPRPNQSASANNRSARKRAERQRDNGLDIVQHRGVATTAGTKGARRRKTGK